MKKSLHSRHLLPLQIALLMLYPALTFAATTDLSDSPLAQSSSANLYPNIMFIFDDSGSMDWVYMPDSVNNDNSSNCFKNSAYNGVYYNPNFTYTPPVDSTGASYPDASFTSAKNDGYGITSTSTTNLNSSFKAYSGDTSQQAYYYNYTGTSPATPVVGTCYANSKYTKVTIGTSDTQATNFANWYTYYRTRINSMKTAVGHAFQPIGSTYRVGFTTISDSGTDSTKNTFLKINDFNQTQKDTFYDKLYKTKTSGYTPLRASLSKVGRMYAGQLLTGTDDPIQYSCQQNFTILSTDGYWNTDDETTTYGPLQINGSSKVGDQDGSTSIARPMYDKNAASNTLADVAMYYYQTDLRTSALGNCTGAKGSGIDVCENNVPGAGSDVNAQQHMTTFTMGLGANGSLAYSEDYLSGGSSDYNAIVQGTKIWPNPITGTNSSTLNRIDDLWHAAVNGRGVYYSAKDPNSMSSGITKSLASITARKGSSAAAATSNLEPVAGDNFVYIALYRTKWWDGDLQAETIDPNTGVISTTAQWSAQALLDAKASATSDTRTIYTYDSSTTTKLKSFTWANLTTTEQGYFTGMCTSSKLTQCTSLTTNQLANVTGANLVAYLRGQSGYEIQASNTTDNQIFRDREHVLGDMINSSPVYVKSPVFNYIDDNYATFRDTTQKNRTPIVYVASNDGMLHAFDAATGNETWAYIPPMVLPNLYHLADKNYPHYYYVDGSPLVADICPNAPATTCTGSQWKTILVGGLNKGGRGYYALDITNPASPKALWNFSVANDSDLGYTFGNPVITKRKDGTWVVAFTSGYNNVSPGDGNGHLYVLNANTGTLLQKLDTQDTSGVNVGSSTTPSGLSKINAWVETASDNTASRFYGGDLLGNIWRFDIDDLVPPSGKEAFLLATVGDPTATYPTPPATSLSVQSITAKPELFDVIVGAASYHAVSVGTGRYLGSNDVTDKAQQSLYTIKDDLTSNSLGIVRNSGKLVQQTLTTVVTNGVTTRQATANPVDWSTKYGWFVDFNPNNDSPGERINVDMQQQLGAILVATNVPNSDLCNAGGYAFLYNFDIANGSYLATSANETVGRKLSSNALVAGIKEIRLANGKIIAVVTDTAGGVNGVNPEGGGGNSNLFPKGKRTGWRELIN